MTKQQLLNRYRDEYSALIRTVILLELDGKLDHTRVNQVLDEQREYFGLPAFPSAPPMTTPAA